MVSGRTRIGMELAANSPDEAPLTTPRERARLITQRCLRRNHETAAKYRVVRDVTTEMRAFAHVAMRLVFEERVEREREGVDAMGVDDLVVDVCVYVVEDETVGVVDVA